MNHRGKEPRITAYLETPSRARAGPAARCDETGQRPAASHVTAPTRADQASRRLHGPPSSSHRKEGAQRPRHPVYGCGSKAPKAAAPRLHGQPGPGRKPAPSPAVSWTPRCRPGARGGPETLGGSKREPRPWACAGLRLQWRSSGNACREVTGTILQAELASSVVSRAESCPLKLTCCGPNSRASERDCVRREAL